MLPPASRSISVGDVRTQRAERHTGTVLAFFSTVGARQVQKAARDEDLSIVNRPSKDPKWLGALHRSDQKLVTAASTGEMVPEFEPLSEPTPQL